MAIIPTIDPKTASQYAKDYLLQYHDWQLIAFRWSVSGQTGSNSARFTHQQASYEYSERLKVIETTKHKDLTCALILYYRFIKRYRTNRTIAELAKKHINISEGRFYHIQREALLLAYEAIPGFKTTMVKRTGSNNSGDSSGIKSGDSSGVSVGVGNEDIRG